MTEAEEAETNKTEAAKEDIIYDKQFKLEMLKLMLAAKLAKDKLNNKKYTAEENQKILATKLIIVEQELNTAKMENTAYRLLVSTIRPDLLYSLGHTALETIDMIRQEAKNREKQEQEQQRSM